MKREWTDTDFAELSWHDNCVHALRIVEGPHGTGELILDLDHILEWLRSEGKFQFRVAPAELRFHGTTDLRMSLDYATPSAGMTPFTLDGILCEPIASNDRSKRWTLKINWPVGEISFDAAGFTQTLTGEPSVIDSQGLSPVQRREHIASRDLVASHPSRGEFIVRLRIGRPYQLTSDEWACPVALEGLQSNLRDQHGADSFQALMLAQNLARTLLAAFVKDGGRLCEFEGGAPMDVEQFFKAGCT